MKKVLGKSLKFYGISCLAIASLIFAVGAASGVYCFVTRNSTYLDGMSFESMEDLHDKLVEIMASHADSELDCWPRDMVTYFDVGDNIAFVSTYSHKPNLPIDENHLSIMFAKKQEEKYYLLTPKLDLGQSATLSLDNKYDDLDDYCIGLFKSDGKNEHYCFLYKEIDESRTLYFDGEKTEEHFTKNPFFKNDFLICTAKTKKDSFWDKLVKPFSERHVIELK